MINPCTLKNTHTYIIHLAVNYFVLNKSCMYIHYTRTTVHVCLFTQHQTSVVYIIFPYFHTKHTKNLSRWVILNFNSIISILKIANILCSAICIRLKLLYENYFQVNSILVYFENMPKKGHIFYMFTHQLAITVCNMSIFFFF